MSPWGARRRGSRPAELTWMPDELELAPDWVREEVMMAPKEFREWLSNQYPAGETMAETKRTGGGRRGRRSRQ